jgi:hypothetical protein
LKTICVLDIKTRTVAAGPRSEAEFSRGVPQIVVDKEGNRAVSIMWTPFMPMNIISTSFGQPARTGSGRID